MLKKTFPVIVVLIALSVLGVIYLQISWLKNQFSVQEERYFERAGAAAFTVKEDLTSQTLSTIPLSRNPWMSADLGSIMMSRPSVASRFSPSEVAEKIRKALNEKGLTNITFEFAITHGQNMGIEMHSKNFETAFVDSMNKNIGIPLLPDANKDMPIVIADEYLYISITNLHAAVRHSLVPQMLASAAFTLIIIGAFFLTVKTILDQRKLSKIKNDFVNNMTHELKTPLATISLAVDALQNSKVMGNAEKSNYFSNIIKQENKRMNKHVETILQAALMDKQEMKLNFAPLHAHETIEKVVNTFTLQLAEKGGKAILNLNAKNDLINGDEIHFTNLVNNLIDNAVKYSKADLHIVITTHSTGRNFIMQVADNGIGMSKETVKRIFEKFYRAHTGNIHNVKGFGLGMSYVKSVVDAHHGRIRVEGVQGKGSTFTIEIPLYKHEQ
ncbi:MAG: HAMP domain-containing histidine kinase [Bacteroidota bacterium]|nr:HAMP domain-containing histidine kinase [Bacteroidota bacterium]